MVDYSYAEAHKPGAYLGGVLWVLEPPLPTKVPLVKWVPKLTNL